MVATPRLIAAWGLPSRTGSPRQVISPASGWCAPASTLISVDLPAPFWPSRQWTSPARTSRSTPSSARTPGNALTIPRICSSGAATAPPDFCSALIISRFTGEPKGALKCGQGHRRELPNCNRGPHRPEAASAGERGVDRLLLEEALDRHESG